VTKGMDVSFKWHPELHRGHGGGEPAHARVHPEDLCFSLQVTIHCSTVLYFTVLYSTVLYCTVLYCAVLCCTARFSSSGVALQTTGKSDVTVTLNMAVTVLLIVVTVLYCTVSMIVTVTVCAGDAVCDAGRNHGARDGALRQVGRADRGRGGVQPAPPGDDAPDVQRERGAPVRHRPTATASTTGP